MPDNQSHETYDLIVLGSGPAGQSIAMGAAQAGRRVLMVEKRELGGTCALRGCNPKKALVQAARIHDANRRMRLKLDGSTLPALQWSTLKTFMDGFTDPVPSNTRDKLTAAGIDIEIGSPRLLNENSLKVAKQTFSFERLAIAVGAKPSELPFEGSELLWTSDEFLQLRELPRRILFIGGGYISMEFAHVVLACGKQPTVLERGRHVLEGFDPKLADILRDDSAASGVIYRMGQTVRSVRQAADGFEVQFAASDDGVVMPSNMPPHETFDLVVHGAGRTANLDGLDLDRANVKTTGRGIKVDSRGQSHANPRIFAAGDCADTGLAPLTTTANLEAETVLHGILNPRAVESLGDPPIAKVAFTPVPIAAVGVLESEAAADIRVRRGNHSSWGSMRKTHQPCAGHCILIGDDGRIMGAHLLGPHADEQINVFVAAMHGGLTEDEVGKCLFGYPTGGSDIRRMLDT